MARTTAQISVGADTRQLERDIQNALARDFKFKGLNEKAFTQPLGRITGASNEFQKSLDASNARVIAFGASAGAIFAVERAFIDLIKSTINVEKSLTDINIILNTTSAGLQKFGQDLFGIAKDTGQAFDSVAQAATELARQGLGVEETLKRTRDALILTRLSGLDTVSSVEALTATLNSFTKTALDSTQVINKLANVDAAFAVSSADLAQAVQRVGSSAQDAGVSFDELLAIVTSVQQTTARGGAVIGNSLKTIFTRIQRTDVLDQLENLGLQVREIDGSTRPAISILQELASTFDNLSDAQRSQVAESVGGVFQINILRAALGDLGKEYSVYNNALRTSATATDEAIKRNEALNETLSALINRTLNNFTQFGAKIGAGAFQPALESTLKNVNSILEIISNQDTESVGAKIGQGILGGLSTFISGPGLLLVTAVLGKLFLDLTKFAATSAKTLLGIGQQAEQRAQIQTKISNILAQEPQLLAAINAKQISVLDVENKILGILREQNALRQQAAALSTTITGGLVNRGVTVKGGQIATKFGGFIPNYVMEEVYGAFAGGYTPGKIKEMNIPRVGKTIYNSAEKVKRFPGLSQPAIMPPLSSKAGKNYKDNFSKIYGFNPYSSKGFIPNFASTAALVNQGFKKISAEQAEVLSRDPEFSKFIRGSATTGFFLDSSVEDKASKAFKVKTEAKLLGRGQGTLGKEEIEKTGAVLVYPSFGGGGLGSTTARANKYVSRNSGESPAFLFSTFGFPGQNTGLGEELYNDIQKKLKNAVYNFIEGATLNPKDLFDDAKFENYVNTNVNRSTIESAVGGVFEAGLKSAIFSAVDDPNAPLDLSQSELTKLSTRFKGAKDLGRFRIGEVKNALNESNAESMANKIASSKGYKLKGGTKTKASLGFIPNFSALGDAISRELNAGVPAESIRVGQNRLLMSNKNPMGLGVYNTKDEPKGLMQGIGRFRSSQEARYAGASGGFIPNYAIYSAAQGEQGPVLVQASKEAEASVGVLIKSVLSGSKSLDEAKVNIDQLSRQFDIAEPSISRLNNSLKQADTVNKRLVAETDALVKQSGRIFGGRRAIEALEKRVARGGVSGELARGGLEQARAARVSASSRLQGIGIGASIAVPIVSQIAQEFFPQNKALKFGVTALADTAAFAGTGALFGPYGAAIGGLIGVTVGLTKAFKNLNDNTELLAKNSQESASRIARSSEDIQSFLSSREKAAGIESGAIAGTPADLAKIESERDKAFSRIYASASPRVQKALEEAYVNSNESALQAALQSAQDEIASTNFVNQFLEKTNKELKDNAKNLDLTDILRQFTGIRTTTGKYLGDLAIEQKDLLGSFDILSVAAERFYGVNDQLAKAMESASVEANKATQSIDEFTKNDLFGFESSGLGQMLRDIPGGQQTYPMGQIAQVTGTGEALGENIIYLEKDRIAYEANLAEALDDSTSRLKQFIINLGKIGELQPDRARALADQLDNLLKNSAIPLTEKSKILQKVLGEVQESSALVENQFKKLKQAQLNLENFATRFNQLFSQDQAIRTSALENIQATNFDKLYNEFIRTAPEIQPGNILKGLYTGNIRAVGSSTLDERKRAAAAKESEIAFKSFAKSVATGGNIDLAFANLQINLQNSATSAGMTTKNSLALGSSIGDAALRTEVLNIYTAKEAELKKQLGDNIIKLNAAASAAADSLQAVAGFQEGTLFADEYKQLRASAREGRIRSGTNRPEDIFESFSDEMVYGNQDAFRDLNNIASDTARTMKSEFNNAFQSIIDGTQDVGDAFRTMALNISRRIQQLALEMTTNMLFNSLFGAVGGIPSIFKNPLGGASGGYVLNNKIQKYSSGGKVIGGSGVRDDVPAMLTKGEYVIKKSSVKKYGDNFLSMLNQGGAVKFRSGGLSSRDMLPLRTGPIKNNPDKTPYNLFGTAFPSAPEGISEQEISQYFNSSIKQSASDTEIGRSIDENLKNVLEQSLVDIGTFKDVQLSSAFRDISSFRGDFGGGFRANLANYYGYDDPRYPTAGRLTLDPLLSQSALLDENDPQNRINQERREALASYLRQGVELYQSNRQSIIDTIQRNREERARVDEINRQNRRNFDQQQSRTLFGGLLQAGLAVGAGALSNYGIPALTNAFRGSSSANVMGQRSTVGDFGRSFNPYRYASYVKDGGYIGYAKGGMSNVDNIPAMLMGGEYVMRKDAVKTYGKQFFDDLNGGKIKKFADGGPVGNFTPENNYSIPTSPTNNINITVNVSNMGESSETTETNTTNISERNTSANEANQLSEKIKTEVVKIIVEQQRPGGLLGSNMYSMRK